MWYLIATILAFCYGSSMAYKAAVVEYNPISADTPTNTILKNLEGYRTQMKKTKSQELDIVVFPEYGLTTMVADPKGYAIEIGPTHPLVGNLSLLAKENAVYMVANLLEKVGTTRTIKYYNTNLVFNRNGDLILKYRKINLFGEPNLTAGSKDQRNTFSTDFGVTFGTFTCFDILYWNPSRTILKNNITDIAYPTSWFSTMPFYASLTVQNGYAASTGVNLLAANLGEPHNAHGGSGIYLTDGTSQLYIGDTPRSEVIVRAVPRRTKKRDKRFCRTTVPLLKSKMCRSNLSNYETLRDFKAADYNFKRVDLGQKSTTVSICYGEFCCNFDISVSESGPGDIYKVMAFDGIVPFDVSTTHVRVCSLLACQNETNDSCGTRVQTGTKFSKITVSGNLVKESTTFYTPLTLDYYLQPLKETTFCEINNDGSSLTQLATLREYEDVIVYGIYGKIDSVSKRN